MRCWFKRIFREALAEEFGETIHRMCLLLGQLEEDLDEINEKIPAVYNAMWDKHESLDANLKKVNEMIQEVKGVVSIARAAMADRKAIDLDMDRAIDQVRKKIADELHANGSKYFVIEKIFQTLNYITELLEVPKSKAVKKK
jgi:hypothetical protein